MLSVASQARQHGGRGRLPSHFPKWCTMPRERVGWRLKVEFFCLWGFSFVPIARYTSAGQVGGAQLLSLLFLAPAARHRWRRGETVLRMDVHKRRRQMLRGHAAERLHQVRKRCTGRGQCCPTVQMCSPVLRTAALLMKNDVE